MIFSDKAVSDLINLMQAFDRELLEHSLGVARLAWQVASFLQIEEKSLLETLLPGALLHDVGKMFIDKVVLQRAGGLTSKEWHEIQLHPVYGALILDEMGLSMDVKELVLYHHERWDGKGYCGIRGDSIPFLAQVVVFADAIEAMSADRPYRAKLAPDQIYVEAKHSCGTQFSPHFMVVLEQTHIWLSGVPLEEGDNSCTRLERKFLDYLVEVLGNFQHPLVQAQNRKLDRLITNRCAYHHG